VPHGQAGAGDVPERMAAVADLGGQPPGALGAAVVTPCLPGGVDGIGLLKLSRSRARR
jgi:hypothetical protein